MFSTLSTSALIKFVKILLTLISLASQLLDQWLGMEWSVISQKKHFKKKRNTTITEIKLATSIPNYSDSR